jgi:hypothetical protein
MSPELFLMLRFFPSPTDCLDQVLLGDWLPTSKVSRCDFSVNFDTRVRWDEML